MNFVGIVIAVIMAAIAWRIWLQAQTLKRAAFISNYSWPPQLLDKLTRKYPHFTRKETSLVSKGLRQFFTAYLKSGQKPVSMPSEVVDDLWHEFILYTKSYQDFCKGAFGGFFHHSPAVMLTSERRESNTGLRRVWWQCCREENIDPKNPTRLPLLFALDSKLDIPNGYRYVADCSGVRKQGNITAQCGGDFSSSGVDGSTDGFGDSSSSGDGGGDSGGGDGGGGCGGGGD